MVEPVRELPAEDVDRGGWLLLWARVHPDQPLRPY